MFLCRRGCIVPTMASLRAGAEGLDVGGWGGVGERAPHEDIVLNKTELLRHHVAPLPPSFLFSISARDCLAQKNSIFTQRDLFFKKCKGEIRL